MGCYVGYAWRCYELCGCVNGALGLFYLYAFQMNPVCVVTSD